MTVRQGLRVLRVPPVLRVQQALRVPPVLQVQQALRVRQVLLVLQDRRDQLDRRDLPVLLVRKALKDYKD